MNNERKKKKVDEIKGITGNNIYVLRGWVCRSIDEIKGKLQTAKRGSKESLPMPYP